MQQHKLPTLWYNLDPGDADPASFFYYLRLAVQILAPNASLALPTLTPDYRPAFGLFANIFREAYKAFPVGAVVVLDNVQDVDQSDEFLMLLETAAREAPPDITLICLSRTGAPPALSRLALNRDLVPLTWDDLKWTVDETQALATALSLPDLPRETTEVLNERAQGWAAGLVLLLQDARGMGPLSLHPGGSADQTLFNYFASEVLCRLPAREREFLLQTAVLPVVAADVAGTLTAVGDPGALLSSLVEKNYFTVWLERPSGIYRYHPLFREFLLQLGAKTLSASALAELRQRAAQLLLERGDAESAVSLLLEAAAWEPFTRAVCDVAPQLIANGRHQRLSGWLDAVPREVVEATPWLLYWSAAALMPVDLVATHDLFARAFDATMAADDHACMAMSWAGAVETIVHSLSHTERLDAWIGKLDTLDRRAHVEASPDLQAMVAPQAVAIYALRGKLASGLEIWVPRAERMRDGPFDASQRILASFALVTYFHWSGQPSRSNPILKKQEASLASGGNAAFCHRYQNKRGVVQLAVRALRTLCQSSRGRPRGHRQDRRTALDLSPPDPGRRSSIDANPLAGRGTIPVPPRTALPTRPRHGSRLLSQ